jgi:hypothetical protein
MVVVLSPMLDRRSSILQSSKPVQIEAVLSELSIEAFDESVLRRFAWLYEMQLHASSLRPEEHRFARKLRAVLHTERSLVLRGGALKGPAR